MSETAATSSAIKFAYWVPNVSGGLVVSKIEQRTDWGYDYNRRLAQLAEQRGFEYALSQVRYMASYGAEYQHESTSFSLALLLATQRLKVIAAVHPGLWQPHVLAKLLATADMKAAIQAQGAEAEAMSPAQLSTLLKSDYAKWKGIVEASGAKIE